MTRKTKRTLKMTAMFLTPVVLVKVTAMMMGAQPEAASAEAPPLPPPLPAVSNGPEWTDAQVAAARYITETAANEFGPTPFLYVTDPHDTAPIEDDPTPPSIDLDVELQMLMGAGSGAKALIQGAIYRVGDVLGETDWIVEEIDVDGRSVTLRHRGTDGLKRLIVRER